MNIRKQLTVVTVIGLIFGNVFVASAQTATTTSTTALQALIQTLQKQIESLTAQIQALQTAQTQLQSATSTMSVGDALQLIGQLKVGVSGEKVSLLQAILAADPSIYPEGRITGYYGQLTAQAVKRYQKMHDLEEVGNVGKKTLEKIGEELDKNPIAMETRGGERRPCAIVPPGHLIAPGWLRKMDGETPIIPVCQRIPEGIGEKHESETTTSDVTASVISEVEAGDVTANSVNIQWKTNEPAIGNIWYGTVSPIVVGNASTIGSPRFVREHEMEISGLSANTTYYYVLTSTDAAGNTATSSQYSFTTTGAADMAAPIITAVSSTGVTASSSRIMWTTDGPATSKVWYATSTPVVTTGAPAVSDMLLVTGHNVLLSGLATSTTYYYVVSSADAAGNAAMSTETSFQTLAQ